MTVGSEFLSSVIRRFKEYKALGEKTFAQLNDEQFHVQPNEASNSIAIIIQHLHGNMLSRWTNFLTEDGEKSWRQRDGEFEAQSQSKERLIALWDQGWQMVLQTLESLNEEDLLKTISIRSQPLTVIDAINRQLAHYGSHVGQVIYIGKWLMNDRWQTLSIPKGSSAAYNNSLKHKA